MVMLQNTRAKSMKRMAAFGTVEQWRIPMEGMTSVFSKVHELMRRLDHRMLASIAQW
jgi:hypothetical protein